MHLPQLERPEDHIGRVVVIEDPDISDADRLAEPLIIVLHERVAIYQAVRDSPIGRWSFVSKIRR